MKTIVCLCGHAENGKTTVANIAIDQLKAVSSTLKTEITPLAKILKNWAINQDWPGQDTSRGKALKEKFKDLDIQVDSEGKPVKTPEMRKYLQELGDVLKAEFDDAIFAKATLDNIINSDADIYFIDDMRFKVEKELFENLNHNDFNVIFVKVDRETGTDFKNSLSEDARQHISETNLNDVPLSFYDIILYNDGTLNDLENQISKSLTATLYKFAHCACDINELEIPTGDLEC